jgi:hypothetical protein
VSGRMETELPHIDFYQTKWLEGEQQLLARVYLHQPNAKNIFRDLVGQWQRSTYVGATDPHTDPDCEWPKHMHAVEVPKATSEHRSLSEKARAASPRLSDRAVAKILGCAESTVWEARGKRKRQRPEKAAGDRARSKSPARRGVCVRCGGPKGAEGVRRQGGMCSACRTAVKEERWSMLERWWAEGLLTREIAERLHKSPSWVSADITAARKAGRNFPYRGGTA